MLPSGGRGTRSSCSSRRRRMSNMAEDLSFSTVSTLSSNDPPLYFHEGMSTSSRRGSSEDKKSSPCTKCFPFRHKRAQEEENDDIAHQNTREIQNLGSGTLPSVLNSNKWGQTSPSGARPEREIRRFSIKEIAAATGNFSRSNIIGEGNFGIVYRGVLNDGTVVAAKCAKNKDIICGRQVSLEFKNEVLTLSQVDHISLVRFYGYLEKNGEAIIVTEFVSNGNLRLHLTGTKGRCLGMAERLQIAIDVSSAITYLHNYTDHPIIHRDVKASNVLITENYRAKVTDFGFARLIDDDQLKTFITTKVKGTEGYLDPEYFKTYRLTKKSDVYSFGVLIVELVTGRPPTDHTNNRKNTELALKDYSAGKLCNVMDIRLGRDKASTATAEKMLELAVRCVEPFSNSRPSMKECSEILWRIRSQFQRLQPSTSSGTSPCHHCNNPTALVNSGSQPMRSRVRGSCSSTAGEQPILSFSSASSFPSSSTITGGGGSHGQFGNTTNEEKTSSCSHYYLCHIL